MTSNNSLMPSTTRWRLSGIPYHGGAAATAKLIARMESGYDGGLNGQRPFSGERTGSFVAIGASESQ